MSLRTVALITPFFDAGTPGGGVLYSVDVVREWLRRGRRVHVLTSTRPRELADLATPLACGDLKLHLVASAEHVRFTHVPFGDVYDAARRELDAIEPDVIHVHNTQGMLSAVRAALDAAEAPTILTALDFGLICLNHCLVDGTPDPCSGPESPRKCRRCLARGGLRGIPGLAARLMPWVLTRRIWPRYVRLEHYKTADGCLDLMRSILRDLDGIVAPSPSLARKLIEYGAPPERVHEVLYGVAPEKVVRPPKTQSDRVRLAFLGGTDPIKGLAVLLEAARRLPEGLSLDILALGGAALAGVLARADARAARYIRAVPARFGRELGEAHAGFDAVLVPSQCHENSPFVILESFANGTPVIASDQPGIRHLLWEGRNGWLVRADCPQAWAEALARAARNPDELRAMREAAHFDRTTAEFVDDLYEIEAAIRRARALGESVRRVDTSRLVSAALA